jgi:hypothetical protein
MPVAGPVSRLGIETREVDLVICSAPLTAKDRRELNAFFREKRAENDKNPEVLALRKRFAKSKR